MSTGRADEATPVDGGYRPAYTEPIAAASPSGHRRILPDSLGPWLPLRSARLVLLASGQWPMATGDVRGGGRHG